MVERKQDVVDPLCLGPLEKTPDT
ncbi:uncharacterized protein G2W53_000285 [Senna tora]|uniref:Uncharacterized protein n=1 Tax=Senna tora TaxID=362788 RepID=A0A834XF87_9FABA|nr:uncharacterized protein G2W53_000285 [Senna tora]